MKKVYFFLLTIFLSVEVIAQKRMYESIEIGFGSNFSKNENAMTVLDVDFIGGYEFSEKFRIGLVFPVSYMVFRDELRTRHKDISIGLGFNVNTLLHTSDIISLRADISFSICDLNPFTKSEPDWIFFRGKAVFQCYFNRFLTNRISPFVSLGMSYYFDSHNLPDNKIKNYQYVIPMIGVGITSKSSK